MENALGEPDASFALLAAAYRQVAGEPSVVEVIHFFDQLSSGAMAFANSEARQRFDREVQAKKLWLWHELESRLPADSVDRAKKSLRQIDSSYPAVVKMVERVCPSCDSQVAFALGFALQGFEIQSSQAAD